jgi:hypothetical protein
MKSILLINKKKIIIIAIVVNIIFFRYTFLCMCRILASNKSRFLVKNTKCENMKVMIRGKETVFINVYAITDCLVDINVAIN